MTDYEKGWRDAMDRAVHFVTVHLMRAVQHGGGRAVVRDALAFIVTELPAVESPKPAPTCPPDCVRRSTAALAVVVAWALGALTVAVVLS